MLAYDISKAGDDSLYHFLSRSIKDDILSGRLEPDAKLPLKMRITSLLPKVLSIHFHERGSL